MVHVSGGRGQYFQDLAGPFSDFCGLKNLRHFLLFCSENIP